MFQYNPWKLVRALVRRLCLGTSETNDGDWSAEAVVPSARVAPLLVGRVLWREIDCHAYSVKSRESVGIKASYWPSPVTPHCSVFYLFLDLSVPSESCVVTQFVFVLSVTCDSLY